MQPGTPGEAGIAAQRDRLPLRHRLAALYQQAAGMAVDRTPAGTVADEHQPAERGDTVTDIGDNAVGHRPDRRAARDRDLDPVVASPPAPVPDPKRRDDIARDRPGETAGAAAGATTGIEEGRTRAVRAAARAAVAATAGLPPVRIESTSSVKAAARCAAEIARFASPGISTCWPTRRR